MKLVAQTAQTKQSRALRRVANPVDHDVDDNLPGRGSERFVEKIELLS